MITEASCGLYGGLDLHSSNVYCGIKDREGRRVYKKRLPTDLGVILEELEPYRERLKGIAVESTYNWYWLVDGLQEAGFPTRLANPARMDQYEGLKVTDDRSDAFWLAEMLRLGILPEGYIYPKEVRPVRDMLRRRLLIVRQRTQMILSLQSMVVRMTGNSVSGTKLKQWTCQEVTDTFVDPDTQETAWTMLQLIQKQDALEKALGKSVLTKAKLCAPFNNLLTVPGIGNALGITIMLENGPMERFKTAGCYASYCRTVASRRESNGKKKGENNRKNGNKYLAWAYVEAANFAQRYDPVVQGWFQRKTRRTCRAVAVKALACKLSKAVFYILRDGVEFDREMMFG